MTTLSRLNKVNIYIDQHNAYLPTMATSEGPYIEVDPVITCAPTLKDIVAAIEHLTVIGHPHITAKLDRHFYKSIGWPLIKATRSKSARAVTKTCKLFGISQDNVGMYLHVHRVDSHGGYAAISDKTKIYPAGSAISTIIDDILSSLSDL